MGHSLILRFISRVVFHLFVGCCIAMLGSCQKSNNLNDFPRICLPPVDVKFDSILVDSTWLFERLFIPSAFTPNGDLINDKFGIVVNFPIGQPDISYNLNFYRGNTHLMEVNSNSRSDYYWDGLNQQGAVTPGAFHVIVSLYKNSQLIYFNNHYFYLLIPNSQRVLPSDCACLTYNANFDSRLGLIYSSSEEFE